MGFIPDGHPIFFRVGRPVNGDAENSNITISLRPVREASGRKDYELNIMGTDPIEVTPWACNTVVIRFQDDRKR